MIIDSENLAKVGTGFNALFNKGFRSVSPIYSKICMTARSGGSEEAYAWLGQLPAVREWIGPRHVHQLELHGFSIQNRLFESTIEVPRTAIEDDKIGAFAPLFEDMGKRTSEFPDELFAELLAAGFTTNCYDGQNFFDTDHPVRAEPDAPATSVSNYQEGAGPAWYLLDLSRPVRPFVYQERMPFVMQRRDQEGDGNVFDRDQYMYGVRGRCNVGFGLWQLAYASKAPLTGENYGIARAAMAKLRGDNGRKLGIQGTHLLVPADLEEAARGLLKGTHLASGASNPWVDSAELMISPWID